jgi:hypothetical protein
VEDDVILYVLAFIGILAVLSLCGIALARYE